MGLGGIIDPDMILAHIRKNYALSRRLSNGEAVQVKHGSGQVIVKAHIQFKRDIYGILTPRRNENLPGWFVPSSPYLNMLSFSK